MFMSIIALAAGARGIWFLADLVADKFSTTFAGLMVWIIFIALLLGAYITLYGLK